MRRRRPLLDIKQRSGQWRVDLPVAVFLDLHEQAALDYIDSVGQPTARAVPGLPAEIGTIVSAVYNMPGPKFSSRISMRNCVPNSGVYRMLSYHV